MENEEKIKAKDRFLHFSDLIINPDYVVSVELKGLSIYINTTKKEHKIPFDSEIVAKTTFSSIKEHLSGTTRL